MHARRRISVEIRPSPAFYSCGVLWRARPRTMTRTVLNRRLTDLTAIGAGPEIRVNYISAANPFPIMRTLVNQGMRRVIGWSLVGESKMKSLTCACCVTAWLENG